MNDWKPRYMVHFEDGTFIYCSTLQFCQRILEKAYSEGYKVKVTGSDFYKEENKIIIEGDEPQDEKIILYINDPVEDLMKEVTQCQENGQQQ